MEAIQNLFLSRRARPKPLTGLEPQQPVQTTMHKDEPAYHYKRYYDDLFGCHKNMSGHPWPFVSLLNLIEAVENGCSVLSSTMAYPPH